MPHDMLVQVYKSNITPKKNRCAIQKRSQRAVVFDFDETIGSFIDLEKLWTGINEWCLDSPDQYPRFDDLFDLYPEFLRYGILYILDYLYQKKKDGHCNRIYIYTNNQCATDLVRLITQYIEHKLQIAEPLFDKIIHAFKINNRVVEVGRSSQYKTHSDFIKCTLLPKSTEICFIDNAYFPDMVNERVYYIHPRAYIHRLSKTQIVSRFIDSDIGKYLNEIGMTVGTNALFQFMFERLTENAVEASVETEGEESVIEIKVAQKIMYHLKEFFYLTKRTQKTQRARKRSVLFTRKL